MLITELLSYKLLAVASYLAWTCKSGINLLDQLLAKCNRPVLVFIAKYSFTDSTFVHLRTFHSD